MTSSQNVSTKSSPSSSFPKIALVNAINPEGHPEWHVFPDGTENEKILGLFLKGYKSAYVASKDCEDLGRVEEPQTL